MSRIGNKPIKIPEGTIVTISPLNEVVVKGKLGELSLTIKKPISVSHEKSTIIVKRPDDKKDSREKHGLYRALIFNMVEGVSKGYKKELELEGVGYRASNKGQQLELNLGYSHNIIFEICPEVKVETISEKGKNPIINLFSHDKQLIGLVSAKIRSFRKVEPYKGKGIKFVGEQIRRKAGKTAG